MLIKGITCIKQHINEKLVVMKPNAIKNPLTMMIHLQNAFRALLTMMSSQRL